MTVLLTINGQEFPYPGPGPNEEWGPDATDWASAVSTGLLQKSGGLFTLLAEVDFGATYGLKSTYYKSRSSNIADAGVLRLARADGINWRNEANDADLSLAVDSSNRLTFDGIIVQQAISVADTSTIDLTLVADELTADIVAGSITNSMINAAAGITYSKLSLTNSIVNADINTAAAIAYSKLNLTGSIVNADVNASAAIAYSKLNLANSIVNADISASAAIAYSKLNLTGSIVNADVSASAAIAHSKIAALTINRALVSDASGIVSVSAVTSTELGYLSGVSSAIQTQINAKVATSSFTAKGDLLVGTGAGTFAALTVGGNGTVLTADSSQATGYTFTSPLTNPMTTSQDIIVGGVAGAANRLAIGASDTILRNSGGTLGYGLLVNANISTSAAIAVTKIAPGTANQVLYTNSAGTAAAWQTPTSPTVQKFTSGSGTYTTPANVRYIQVLMVGGGGGGCGTGSGSTSGVIGNATTFGTTLLNAGAGSPGTTGAIGGSGGTASLGTGPIGLALVGGKGTATNGISAVNQTGSDGADSPIFGGGGRAVYQNAGSAGLANTGGGGGGGSTAATSNAGGSGGGSGGVVDAIITAPLSSYAYVVGAGGGGGTNGSGGANGGAGGSGQIVVYEFY